ncbi:MAG: hypothetical protein ACKOC4_08845 [Planctomycetia bacterium]
MSCRSITSPSRWAGFAAAVAAVGLAVCRADEPAVLRAAAAAFTVAPPAGDSLATLGLTGAAAQRVVEPLETVVFLLESAGRRHVLVTTHFSTVLHVNASAELRRIAAAATGTPVERVWIFSSHNHSDLLLATNGLEIFQLQTPEPPPIAWNPVGERFVTGLRETAARLPDRLVPVTVHHAVATEDRLTYNRKGRRADGSTYFMREEDRLLVAADYRGDVDTQAPLVVFADEAGHAVAALAQFTGHPVTSYNPERPVVHGDWPQTACRVVAAALAERDAAGGGPAGRTVPVGFLQGCAGDVNSKGMFAPDGPARAEEFGRMLGGRLAESIPRLVASRRGGGDLAVTRVPVPLGPLPPRPEIVAELAEIDGFLRRAAADYPDTLTCVGLNFPRILSPAYRGKLVAAVRPWYDWALEQHATGRADTLPRSLDVEVVSIRLGDVGIVGFPCEPFQGIGRLARASGTLPLTIACGYANLTHGYIPDAPNVGDREYMSSFHRYTRFRPPFARPAGDVMALRGVAALDRMTRGE